MGWFGGGGGKRGTGELRTGSVGERGYDDEEEVERGSKRHVALW